MKRLMRPALCLSVGLMLAGCATDDPRKGGFFGGLFGLGSGSYTARVDDEKTALRAEEVRYQDEVASRAILDRTLKGRRARAADLKGQVVSLREGVAGLDAEIERLRREKTVTRDEVEEAEAGVASLIDGIDRIEAEQEVLEQAKALGADADEDTDPAEFGEPPREEVSDLRAYIIKLQEAVDGLKSARERRANEALQSGAD